MVSAITVLWILTVGGQLTFRDYPSFEACHATQQVLRAEEAAVGVRRYEYVMCIGEARP